MPRPEELEPVLAELAGAIERAVAAADLPPVDPGFERPRDPDHGDWASTLALRLAKPAKRPPRAVAEAVVEQLELPRAFDAVEIAGPGFLNFRLAPAYFSSLVARIVAVGERYGRSASADGMREHIDVEFVSANPTGPLHVGAGRWAATGDAIAALLEAEGHSVHREYYVNDAGEQIRKFGESVVLVHRGEPLGEGHYLGDYIAEIARELAAEHGDELFAPDPLDSDDHRLQVAGTRHIEGELVVSEETVGGPDPRVEPGVAEAVGELAVRKMRDRIARRCTTWESTTTSGSPSG